MCVGSNQEAKLLLSFIQLREINKFFSVPVSIIRTRAKLPPPLPGQPRPFSLGADGVIENSFRQARFIKVESVLVDYLCLCLLQKIVCSLRKNPSVHYLK